MMLKEQDTLEILEHQRHSKAISLSELEMLMLPPLIGEPKELSTQLKIKNLAEVAGPFQQLDPLKSTTQLSMDQSLNSPNNN